MAKKLSKKKSRKLARNILKKGSAYGKGLTEKQKAFFKWKSTRAGGNIRD